MKHFQEDNGCCLTLKTIKKSLKNPNNLQNRIINN